MLLKLNKHNKSYKKISAYACKLKPLTQPQWGWFLAGIIDGDGHFNKLGYLVLTFDAYDVGTAYEIKRYLGYGTVSKVADKNAYTFILSHPKGREIVAKLVQNKLKHKLKIQHYNSRFVPALNLPLTSTHNMLDFDNHWLCGFIQSDGSFQIKALERPRRKNIEFRTVVQIDQKESHLLDLIKMHYGGYVGFRESQNTYYYSSVSFHNAVKFISYLDQFQVRNAKATAYKLWRASYVQIQNGKHIGLDSGKILKRKRKLSKIYKINHV